ncbi:MAG TPA: GNAT family N-acetyltransferase, partial [Flavobacterium sp.]|nr:GNAT family N-acetyltransferase [Flavobacterium sp.]
TEAAMAVMNWASINFGVENFIASVLPENKDSLKLISRLGFKKVSEVMDDIDGLEYVFLRNIIDHL